MTVVIIRPLPHGKIPYDSIADQMLKRMVMLLNENIISLKKQLEEAQKAIQELQKK